MTGRASSGDRTRTLLADANVLIDYRDSDLEILSLVARWIGPVAVVSTVFEEVRRMTVEDCERLGIRVVEATTKQQLQAARLESTVSFNDRVCFVMCREQRWTCVTNDRALQRLCRRHAVEARFGLGLLVDLVRVGAIPRTRAEAAARKIHILNPLYITESVIARFLAALDAVIGR